jgi:O-antigen/teichoic acid export membrane protein
MTVMRADEAAGSPPVVKIDVLDTPEAGPRALRGSVLRTLGYVLGILVSLAAVPLLISHLGFGGYGSYVAVISLTTIVAGLTEGGLNAIALRECSAANAAERVRLIRDALGARIVLTSVGAALAVAFAAAAGYGGRLVLGTAAAGVALELQMIASLLGVELQAELRFGWISAIDLVRQIVNVVGVVALVLAGAGIVLLLVATIPAAAAALLLTAVLVRGRMPLRPGFELRSYWRLVHESIPWAAVAALNVVYFRLTIVIMKIVESSTQTGYFATSFRIIEVLIGIPSLAVGAAYPILTRSVTADRDRFEYASERLFELALVSAAGMVVWLEVGAHFAIGVLASSQSAHAVEATTSVLRIQGPALVGTFVGVACGYPLLTLRRYRAALSANLVALLISATLIVPLATLLAARGAAITALVGELTLGLLSAVFLRRVAPNVPLRAGSVVRVAIAAAVAIAAGVLAPIHPVLGVLLASAVYLGALALVGRLPPELREFAELAAGRVRRAG